MDSSNSKDYIPNKFKEIYDLVITRLKDDAKTETLIKLKQLYKDKINSKRTFDRICDYENLFSVLKKRDELSHEKLNPFLNASTIICDNNLRKTIEEVEKEFRRFEYKELYKSGKLPSQGENSKLLGNSGSEEQEINNISSKDRNKNIFSRNKRKN